jgi:hypothetical protein
MAIPVGDGYEVLVEASGFKLAATKGITLLVNQVYRADVKLQVGAVTQQVEVSASRV